MAFVFADSVKETSTTTGTGTLNLAGAVSGFRTFVAGIATGNTCPYTIEDANGTAWEHGIGTVTDATPDTLSRTTILSSSTGSAISLSAGTHTVYCAWPAERAQQANLEHVAGTDADTTMAVGQMYVVDMSAWATADRTYTLPATAIVGDRVGIMVSAGDASHELIITANTGDTLNAIAGGTEWSRLFITGEVVIMRCIAANATWIVERDGRIPQKALMRNTTAATAETANTWTRPTTKSGVWTAVVDIGSIVDTTADKMTVRRAGKYCFAAAALANSTSSAADKDYGVGVFKNGTTNIVANNLMTMPAVGVRGQGIVSVMGFALAADDYLVYTFWSVEGSRGLLANTTDDIRCSLSVMEVLP